MERLTNRKGMVRVKATMDECEEGTIGGCISCGEKQSGCEPDARKDDCESCGEATVYGLGELAIMDTLEITDDSDEE